MLKWLLDNRRKATLPPDPDRDSLDDRIHRLEIKFAQLQELHEQLQGHHDKLRSKIWGYIGGNQVEEPRTRREGRTADYIAPGTSHADILGARASARAK